MTSAALVCDMSVRGRRAGCRRTVPMDTNVRFDMNAVAERWRAASLWMELSEKEAAQGVGDAGMTLIRIGKKAVYQEQG